MEKTRLDLSRARSHGTLRWLLYAEIGAPLTTANDGISFDLRAGEHHPAGVVGCIEVDGDSAISDVRCDHRGHVGVVIERLETWLPG